MRSSAAFVCFCLVWVLAGEANAQASTADSARLEAQCRLAERALATGIPSPHVEWAAHFIPACGPARASRAIVGAIRRTRETSDTAVLRTVWQPATWIRDAGLFEAEMSLASEPRASAAARVYAFKALLVLQHPGRDVEYRDMVGGFDQTLPVLAPRGGCGAGRFSTHTYKTTGDPLPSDFLERIRALRRKVVTDPGEPLDVRTAAACG